MGIEPFIGEVILFAGNFAPTGWAFCHGQLMPINQHTALFSLLGTTYGGNGTTNFALPDLRGRVPISAGQGPGMTDRMLGSSGGSETHALTTNEMPAHTHDTQLELFASSNPAQQQQPQNNVMAASAQPGYGSPDNLTAMAEESLDLAMAGAGQGQAHPNMQPYLTLNYIIAMQGIFPSRP